MAMHDHHQGLPGYAEAQVLHDGCGECETRAGSRDHGISAMDLYTFQRAWSRSLEWNRHGLADVAVAEVPALSVIWSVALKFEAAGLPLTQQRAVLFGGLLFGGYLLGDHDAAVRQASDASDAAMRPEVVDPVVNAEAADAAEWHAEHARDDDASIYNLGHHPGDGCMGDGR